MTGSLAMERTADARRLLLRGRLVLADGQPSWAGLREIVRDSPQLESIDLSGIERIDGAGAAWLLAVRADAARLGRRIELSGSRPQTQRLLDLYRCPTEFACLKDAPRETPVLAEIGASTMDLVQGFRGVLTYSGDLVFAMVRVLRNPRSLNWGDVPRLIERTGADAVPIVLMINFLIGLIVALQAAEQLQRFGASQLLADLVGLSLTRELAPLITAILVAGRSGAAFAAELGTMRVNEEIDALRTLGIDPERHLVLPRVVALALVAPVLTALGMGIGIFAGMLIGMVRLDLTPVGYWNELVLAVRGLDVAEGLTKSLVFAMIATFIACQRGLAARGGAAGVGMSTTSAVVTIIFHLVAADTLLSITFNMLRG